MTNVRRAAMICLKIRMMYTPTIAMKLVLFAESCADTAILLWDTCRIR